MVEDTLGGGPFELGLLVSATGLGALAASLTTETTARIFGRGRTALGALGLAALCLIGLSASRHLLLSVVLVAVCATASITYQASAAMVVHLAAHPDDRGRVVGTYDIARLSLVPAGTVLVGYLADRIGPVLACAVTGGVTLAAVALLRWFVRGSIGEAGSAPEGQLRV